MTHIWRLIMDRKRHSFYIDTKTIKLLDIIAKKHNMTRSAALRMLFQYIPRLDSDLSKVGKG